MAPVTRRTSAAPARPPARKTAAPVASSGYRGEEGRRKMEEEQERAAARREAAAQSSGAPFRFFCPVGETREIVVVDDEPDFFRHEHNIKDSYGKWKVFTSCINETANCPVCAAYPDKQPYFAMYLTVIDLTPYTNKDGIEVPWSKKLLVVKPQQQKKISRLFERNGSLRGMVLSMTRDGDKDASIGNDIEFSGEVMSEEDLATYVSQYEDKQNKVVEVVGGEPFDYEALFPAQTEEMLAALVGGHTHSHEAHSRNIGRSSGGRAAPGRSGDDWQDRSPPTRGAAPSRRRPEPDPGEGDDAQDEAPPPRRAASRAAPAPAARPAGRPAPRSAAPQDEGDEGDEAQDDPPQRVAPRAASRAAPAPAPATSLAERRRALRR